jgi:hypothetical protein
LITKLLTKEYGKLTAEQFSSFVSKLPEVFALLDDIDERLSSTPGSMFDEVMADDYGLYSYVYERPFVEHLAVVVVAFNRSSDLAKFAAAPDPQQAVLDSLQVDEEDRPAHEAFGECGALALGYSLFRTIKCIATYGRSISSLLKEVRDQGSHEALFKAIRMDRAVIGCPTAMRHIARSQMRDNKAFFKRLRSALAGPSKKEWRGLDRMRYAFLMLRELGIDDLSEKQLEELMVVKLGVYHPGKGDARKNLRAHYIQSRKIPTL